MPKATTTPFTYYTFRFDYDTEEQVEKIKDYVIKEIPSYALFREISTEVGKAHLQGKLGKAISEEQLRKHFKKEFPGYFLKSNYSIKSINDADKYDSYICKDGDVLCNNVFDQSFIDEQVKIHKENKAAFEKKIQKQKSIVQFSEKVFSDFIKEFPKEVEYIQWIPYNPSDEDKKRQEDAQEALLDFILKRLGKAVKVFDDAILQRMYTGIKNAIIQLDAKSSQFQTKKYKSRIEM